MAAPTVESKLCAALAPTMLIAMPGMEDGFFTRTVILLVEHGDQGAGGVVLNRMAPLDLDTLLKSTGLDSAPSGPHPVWVGGPVQPQAGLVLYLDEGRKRYDHDVEVMPGVRLSASLNVLRDVAAGKGPTTFGLYLGRAGWGPGQLEDEMAKGAWLSTEPDLSLLFSTDGDQAWRRALSAFGTDEQHVVREIASA
ncbi:MAG: hypothetical protein EXR77_07865 [Myxococcales bacterium]|nr:hypothetical protein [Myxococcales bacterium]